MNLTVLQQLLFGLALIMSLMTVLWLVGRSMRNAGLVDVGWAMGVGLLAVLFAATTPGDVARRGLVATMFGLWSLRLAGYLLIDRVLGQPEDGRYQELRRRWGDRAPARFFWLFEAQAVLAVLFALPALIVLRTRSGSLDGRDLVGVAIWLVAIGGELLADWQLRRFKSNPSHAGQTCSSGLWRYSRHPNYFFEWLHWWAYVVMASSSAWGLLTLAAPLLMLFFLFKITGIPATEAQALRSRGEAYRRYQQTTSVFVPWFPKESP